MNIVVLTGAGISAESGVPTFRGADGLWEGHRVEEVATPEAFVRDPHLVHHFYNLRRAKLLDGTIHPNPAHQALARLAASKEHRLFLVTQNIDDLHERGGSPDVLHMHGELLKSRCTECGAVADCREDLGRASVCKACGHLDCLRPHVVWFGEMPFGLDEISVAISQADLFVAIGTSGNVYPAAGFVFLARQAGIKTLEINLEVSEGTRIFHESRRGRAGDLVPQWVDELQ
ncbi:NAD-dependent deacylase [Luteolibacter sp. GHJ8]|uniref:NAD-dependent protein deacylase n=1 Tax=Luteolibacter rhizosphaerae TaxID=2989719 RepID=A0ABT3GAC9_9BACT|nr:NAD-dependent deacylase [Luteolibacter rhizosphaerae]MCW1916471.1 NAD-dependent deacylase [Luteolibacter rhizosphaerae]